MPQDMHIVENSISYYINLSMDEKLTVYFFDILDVS